MRIEGWLFDLYPSPQGMTLWVIEPNRKHHRLIDSFSPAFYVHGSPARLARVQRALAGRYAVTTRLVERTHLWDAARWTVLEIAVHSPTQFDAVRRFVRRLDSTLRLYNSDLLLAALYGFEKRVFPLAWCELEVDAERRVRVLACQDDPWALDYELPPFQVMHLRLAGVETRNPKRISQASLEVEIEGRCSELSDLDEPAAVAFNRMLARYDPDLVVTDWGDSLLLPGLLRQARRQRLALRLNRDPDHPVQHTRARSFVSYGRTLFKDSSTMLFGRLHVDTRNSFIAGECDLAGLWELARLTKLPVQYAARTTTGTGISYMQMEVLYRDQILIPEQKSEPEEFKRPDQLLLADRGGLVFPPRIGFHENVAELDWPSMFPTIMARFNVSSETINCRCCPASPPIPELGYRICQRRRGIAGRTVAPLIEKRQRYKERLGQISSPALRQTYKLRRDAAKWLLVCCFGYLGYKNARVGRIEAHEAINAIARESLLRAKEVAEGAGFRLLHAIVDSIYVHKPEATRLDYEQLAHRLSEVTGLPIALEAVYRYLIFLPSKQFDDIPVPNRFFAVSEAGELKVRGLELRKHDTPPIVARMQEEVLCLLAEAHDFASYRQKLGEAEAVLARYEEKLASGRLAWEDLVIRKRLTQPPERYAKASLVAVAAQQLAVRGLRLRPGEFVEYVITAADASLPYERVRAAALLDGTQGFDRKKYLELLREAFEPFHHFCPLEWLTPGRSER
ncbi:MAG: hypothetical protein HY653_07370 [Acidobacteria bacterium]|nr:hypothetical protein [Acidobacteriota bacterium]